MKKYALILTAALACCAGTACAADFGDLLERLNSRDFSAEKDVVTGRGQVYVGELVNPHSETPMFKARDEFRAKLTAAILAKDEQALDDLRGFITGAMKADVSDETKVWLLEQLGVIGVDKNVPDVAELLKSDSRRLVDGAAACLAKIPGEAALKALQDNVSIPTVAAALLSRQTTSIPADGVESSWPQMVSRASDEEVEEYLKKYDELDAWTQTEVLAGLAARDNKKYRPYALKALQSDDANLKAGGFLALEKLATAEDVPVFIQKLGENRNLAIRLAGFVVADGFDDALLAAFDEAKDEQLFKDLAVILTNRAVDVRPRIFAKTTAKDCPNRLDLLKKAREIAQPSDVRSFADSIMLMPRGKDRDAAENLVASLCNKKAEPIIELFGAVPAEYNDLLLNLVARTGGDAAKETVAKLLDSSNPAEQAAGLRALNLWADGQFTDKIETLLKSDKLSEAQLIALQRAYIRTVSLPDDQIGIKLSRDEKLAKLQQAYNSAKRADEKALVLSRLAANRTAKSMEYAIECAADSDQKVKDAAYQAIADHVHDTILRKENPELAAKGIEIILNGSKDEKLIERVKVYKGRMEQ